MGGGMGVGGIQLKKNRGETKRMKLDARNLLTNTCTALSLSTQALRTLVNTSAPCVALVNAFRVLSNLTFA